MASDVDVWQPYNDAPQEIQHIVREVLQLEKENIYKEKPHVNAEIINIVKEHVS